MPFEEPKLAGGCDMNVRQAATTLDREIREGLGREAAIYSKAELEADAILELKLRKPIHKVKYIVRDGELYTEDGRSFEDIINPINNPFPLPKEVLAQYREMKEALLRGFRVKQVLTPSPARLYGSDYSGIGSFTMLATFSSDWKFGVFEAA